MERQKCVLLGPSVFELHLEEMTWASGYDINHRSKRLRIRITVPTETSERVGGGLG